VLFCYKLLLIKYVYVTNVTNLESRNLTKDQYAKQSGSTLRYAMGVEYVGTNFSGWQKQPDQRCVQSELEKILGSIANEEINTICAGRTDTGVHALGQVVHFDTSAQRDQRNWLLGSNTLLPNDISIAWVKQVDAEFHARFGANARSYRYIISNRFARSAVYDKRALWIYKPLDHEAMHIAAQALVGEHDFSSLRGADCQSNTPFRNVHNISVKRNDNWIFVDVTANAFLHHMVRNIVGSLLAVGEGKKPTQWIAEMLAEKDRSAAGVTAAACGLYFMHVFYPPSFGLPEVSYSPLPL